MSLICNYCGGEVDPHDPGTLYQVTGWEKLREQGGQNHVRFRERTGLVMCSTCATARKYGRHEQQETLL